MDLLDPSTRHVTPRPSLPVSPTSSLGPMSLPLSDCLSAMFAKFKRLVYPSYKSPHDLFSCFVLTRMVPTVTSPKVTHPETTPVQAYLTVEFSQDVWPKDKCTLVIYVVISILLNLSTYTPYSWNKGVTHPLNLKKLTKNCRNEHLEIDL